MVEPDLSKLNIADAKDDQPSCAVCGHPSTIRCQRCSERFDTNGDPVAFRAYCGKQCKAVDSDQRQLVCATANNLKQLYRAGEFVQAGFYLYHRVCFDIPVSKASTGPEGKLHLQEKSGTEREVLRNFRAHLFSTEEDGQVVLVWMAGADGLVRLHKMIQGCLEGIDDKVKDVMLRIPASHRRIAWHRAAGDHD